MLKDEVLLDIARGRLGLDTLEARNSDAADYKDQAVWNIKAALDDAYEAGRTSVLFLESR